VTPDSFSDAGRFADSQAAADFAVEMAENGADLIDVGGESTRPGATPVAAEEQIRRVEPVIQMIRRRSAMALSIDTRSWRVAERALAAGADLVNDVSAGRDDPAMLAQVCQCGVPIILMHMQGTPLTMQNDPRYQNVTREVADFLSGRLAAAQNAGIDRRRVLLDPGIGFGKSVDHSLALLRDLSILARIGRPLVVGASRKSFIGKVLSEPDPLGRVWGDAAVISWAAANGAGMVRVHDVRQAAQILKMTCAVMTGRAAATKE
jgi:dihydropteroate synthase